MHEIMIYFQKNSSLSFVVYQMKNISLSHVLRNDEYFILQLIMKGKIEEMGRIGRSIRLRNIRIVLNFEKLIRTTAKREEFAMVFANLR